jgi:hypothetical protein
MRGPPVRPAGGTRNRARGGLGAAYLRRLQAYSSAREIASPGMCDRSGLESSKDDPMSLGLTSAHRDTQPRLSRARSAAKEDIAGPFQGPAVGEGLTARAARY